MSTLYIRLPSKAAIDSAPQDSPLSCQFALVSNGVAIEREGAAPLSDLSELAGKAQQVVLLLAASDVTLLHLQVPPLSASRLRAALPNLVEDHLMSDPADCVVVAGNTSDGLRTVAVMDRAWLELLGKSLNDLGVHNIAALPAQLCLPYEPGTVSAAVSGQDGGIDVALRLSGDGGIGLPILPEQPESAVAEALQAMCMIVPHAPITLYVPQASVPAYQEALADNVELQSRITLFADNWGRWIAGAQNTTLNLMEGLGSGNAMQDVDWRPWRWPFILVAVVLAINVIGLNVEWLRMKREANGLQALMLQTYKATYPKDTVIIDPIAQMQKKIAISQHLAGQSAPDDFLAMAAAFGEAWNGIGSAAQGGIGAMEYRDRALQVKPKQESEVSMQQMKSTLAARNLSLTQPSAGTWLIRSGK